VTSYYEERWGFCIPHSERLLLAKGSYQVDIESEFKHGEMSYGELVIPGELKEEVLISTYLCHPSMANNELSGPVVASYLARIILDRHYRKYTYRFVIIPETIGSIAYLAQNLSHLKENVVAGYVLTCIGDDRAHSYLPSRNGDTLSDKIARKTLSANYPNLKIYPWSSRGSDERQFCAPGIDLPIGSIMKSKYWEYPEYHTSLDTLGDVVTPSGLEDGLEMVLSVIDQLEKGFFPKATNLGEPNLGRRGLYPTTSIKGGYESIISTRELLTWADGKHSLEEIAEKSQIPISSLTEIANRLAEQKLLSGQPRTTA
jgi:aminopeptidase-like protein